MKRSPLASIVFLVFLGAFLLGGVVHLFQLRFEAGDIYPAYSSLRADPKGTRVLFESLQQLPQIETIRNVRPLHRQEADAETTLLLTGVYRRLPDETVDEIKRFLQIGARVVVTYYPFMERDEYQLDRLILRPIQEREGELDLTVEDYQTVNLAADLGRAFDYGLRFQRGPVGYENVPLEGIRQDPDWPAGRVPDFWLSRLYLEPGDDWEVLAWLQEDPVMMQRSHEGGTLIVMTDSYWLSNEAMRLTRRTDFVTWLLGSSRTIIFDETHLGVLDREGLSHLMRRMNLELPIGILLLLACLFVWKNGAAFPPRALSAEPENGDVAGHDSQAGLVNLLRANIPRGRVFSLCWEEWLRTLEPAERKRLGARIEAAAEVVKLQESGRRRERDMVSDYQKTAEILNERKHVWKQ